MVPYTTTRLYKLEERGLIYPLCSNVLMLKPSVGEMVLTSSPLNFFRMVVLPALSSPLQVPG